MTDRLSTLLHDEASAIDVPSPATDRVIAKGRRLRQRRRAQNALAGAAAVALVTVGAAVAANQLTGGDHAVSPAEQLGYEQQGVWAVGNQVHVGDHVVEIPGAQGDHSTVMVGGIGYTSVGALVSYVNLDSRELRSSTLLVTPSGETRQLGKLDGIAYDPGSSVIVYARAASDPHTWELVARDLANDQERTVGTPWHANDAPELSMSGDLVVYVRGNRMQAIDWRTGYPVALPQQEIGMTIMQSYGRGGYLTAPEQGKPTRIWHLRGLPDGNVLGTFPDGGDGLVRMSPDGRFLMTGGHGSVTVYDVASQKATPLELTGSVSDYGWTPDGHVVGAQGSHVAVCDPGDGSCSDVGNVGSERLSLAVGAFDSDPMAGD